MNFMSIYKKEKDFEEDLIKMLSTKGWESKVIKNPTEQDLIDNWAKILFENNREIDRLNEVPLTSTEMQQIMDEIAHLRTPLMLNGFINGKTVTIKRDNAEDKLHCGKEISLKIYDRNEIAAGSSRYQIAQQPKFPARSAMLNDRRGDIMLLINGMPVIHIELKRSGVPVSQACNQIEKYAGEGVFTGIFSLVQIFVAMNPDETIYFANPGPSGVFNHDYFFHWADFNNQPINGWKDIASSFISIPMAHQLIGFYTVADNSDGVLKVMRSYQYYAANAISDRVAKATWTHSDILGGYIWHTTGSGKTLTSFKSAQLIAASGNADKVIFLMDRIELGVQSLHEYKAFATPYESVQATENSHILAKKIKSNAVADTLIVTSIQKMSRIKDESDWLTIEEIESMNQKRIVFIIDEAHRSTFGEMLVDIKNSFPSAMFFGFTGTPIKDENSRKLNTTSDILGSELHRYTIADGIKDKNVLGFDPYRVATYRDMDIRKVVGLMKAKANDELEAFSDEKKKEIYEKYLYKVPMAGYTDDCGNYIKGIEDFVPNVQYETDEHTSAVVKDIKDNWLTLSRNGKFHGIFATSSINEAINYYYLLRNVLPELKITALFDPNIDNNGQYKYKEEGLVEIMTDYNNMYGKSFTLPTHAAFKRDISARLSHKEPYTDRRITDNDTPETRENKIAYNKDKQLDLLIVVDQMLTGFDSKWINTLYMDKVMDYENIIQAFSRTNRLFGQDKPFGVIRYYRRPHTMERNINDAVKLYSGDKPLDLFAYKLPKNIKKMNELFADISDIFINAGIDDFIKLPPEKHDRAKFANLFVRLNGYLEAATLQGFKWNVYSYAYRDKETGKEKTVGQDFDQNTYHILYLRYQELLTGNGTGGCGDDIPFDLESHITEVDTGRIDADYMDTAFQKWCKVLKKEGASQEVIDKALDALYSTFPSLTQEEQKFAQIFIHDVQRGEATLEAGKTIQDYISDYRAKENDSKINEIVNCLGIDVTMFRNILSKKVTEGNINENNQFSELKASADVEKAKIYFEELQSKKLIMPKVKMALDKFLREFILQNS